MRDNLTNLKYTNELQQKYSNLTRSVNEEFINIHPIQRGGILTPEAYKALIAYADGYSLCDNCLKGRIDKIENPPVIEFLKDSASYFNIENIMPTGAARKAKQIVMKILSKKYPKRKTVVVDSLAHYTTYLAIETNDLRVREVPHEGYPEFQLNSERFREIINYVIKQESEPPLLVVLTHVDYKYGNYNDPNPIGEICQEFDIPFLLNAAYSGGILPIDCKNAHIDFLACSGHKSMAASGPIGLLGFKEEYYEDVMVHSKIEGNITNKSFHNKICTFMGCPPVYGAPLVTLMASFPTIVKRTQEKYVSEESKKVNYVIKNIQKIKDLKVLGVLPKIHPLTNVETECFQKVAETHPRRGFFLREEFKERGIIGMLPGISKEIKFNTFNLTWDQVQYFTQVFMDIAKKYQLL
ncbi:MAG: O-phospho-L-seryl-tRNA:Cys-tRNA synthase 2 [Promethearchaeota archaeon]|nr:MAG: O-phospho-L-seryl-tRNA:Cys-tRNA synthase 2 [Candidatus Lokiarchaeota archaeon]